MDVVESSPSLPTHGAAAVVGAASAVRDVRSQVAFLRALLDEIDRATSAGARSAESSAALSTQVVEELARLGCRCVELASALAEPPSLSLSSPSSGVLPTGADSAPASGVSRCA